MLNPLDFFGKNTLLMLNVFGWKEDGDSVSVGTVRVGGEVGGLEGISGIVVVGV